MAMSWNNQGRFNVPILSGTTGARSEVYSSTTPKGGTLWVVVDADSAFVSLDIWDADSGTWISVVTGSGAPSDADYLIGTINALLPNAIVAGATPGGELGGTWDTPTVDDTHSGSSHGDLPAGAQVDGALILTDASVAGGELGGTYPDPTIDATHSGSSHSNLPAGAQVDGALILTLSNSIGVITIDLLTAVRTANGAEIITQATNPFLELTNGATDPSQRLRWSVGNTDQISIPFSYPPDLDDTQDLTISLMSWLNGATDTPTIAVGYYEGIGGSNDGGNTAAVSGTVPAQKTVTIAAANISPYPNFASITIAPAAHGTDILYIHPKILVVYRKKAVA